MVVRGLARRWLCLVFACLVMVMLPLCAYAGIGDYRVASGSDADVRSDVDAQPDVDTRVEEMLGLLEGEIPAVDPGAGALDAAGLADMSDVPPGFGLPGLLAGATEEELERYYQSFLEYPVSLLEWPEEVPQPRFAIAAVGAAAVWVLKLLLVAAGIYVGVEFTENVWQMFQNYETYLRMNGDDTLLESWQSILQAQWGGAVTGMVPQYRMFKQFCKEEVGGYGASSPELGIPPASSVDFPYYSSFDSASYFPNGYAFGVSSFVSSSYSDLYFKDPIPVLYNVSDYGRDAKQLALPRSIRQNYSTGWCITVYEHGGALSVTEATVSSSFMVSVASVQSFSIPVFDNAEDAENYLLTGDTTGVLNAPTVFVPAKQWSDVQNKDFADIADTLVVPIDQAAADEIESNISAAAGAAEVAKALEKTWDLGQAQEGTDEEAYPWVPSITGWLEKLAQGIDSIKGWVSAIPDALSNIWESVQALPQTIAQALEDVVVGEDDGTYSITESVTTKFPFCIPFDLVNCFRILQAEASAPVFRVPFIIDLPAFKFSYEFVLDISDWERPIAVVRFFILVIYIGALIYATRYLIKG